MIVKAKKDRELVLIRAQNTQNENKAETLEINVPEEYEDYNKKIVFITNNGTVWDVIQNNEYKLTNAITKYKQVDFYIWLTKDDIDFRSKTKTIKFYDNIDASDEITPEEISGVNTVVNILEDEIDKVENLNITAQKIGTQTTITITKKDGTTESVEINDGTDGQDGRDGKDGDDYVITQQDYQNIANIVEQEINIPSKTSQLQNDSGFITNAVDNLINYYLKSEIYTQTEVNSLIGAISTMNLQVVQTLPTQDISTTTIYLVPKTTVETNDAYDEYIYVSNNWEHIGSTEVDLTGYATETWVNTQISGKLDTSKVKNANSTTAGDVYDVRYINTMLGNIESLLAEV